MKHTVRGIAYLLVLGLASCNGDMGAPGTGAFTVNVEGDVIRTVQGDGATFGVQTIPPVGVQVWTLNLQVGSGTDLAGVSFVTPGLRPANGTYSLIAATPQEVPPDAIGAFVTLPIEGASPGFSGASQSGTLTITTSRGNAVRGSFRFEATGTLAFSDRGPTNGAATLSGDFDAAPGVPIR